MEVAMWALLVGSCLLQLSRAQTLWQKTTFTAGHPLDGFATVSTGHFGDESTSVVKDPAGSGQVIRVAYQKGSYSQSSSHKGAQFYSKPVGSHRSLTLSYDLYFSDNFDFNKGGKLPGLYGGGYTCSGGRHSEDCFSTRFMWREGGAGEIYAYQTSHQPSGYCSRAHVECNPEYGNSLGRGTWHFQKGKWQNIAQHVHLNTPGQNDGFLKVWLDGKQVFQLDNMAFISKSMQIDGLFFSTFFGGSTSEWAAPNDCYTYYKNFVLSTDSAHPVIVG